MKPYTARQLRDAAALGVHLWQCGIFRIDKDKAGLFRQTEVPERF